MTKQNPKMILNLSVENDELEEKVKIAMDKYAEQLVLKNLDDAILKIVDKRIQRLINASSWDSERKIQGVTLDQFVKDRTEQVLADFIDKNAKELLAKKLASLL
ncbi:MAG: hypothetical protein PUC73_12620 [Lachnospiraceae bacterium]|nr:hypothetical protein [Lachnospiraceae bacterium]